MAQDSYCEICGIDVDPNTSLKRFGKRFCSDAHVNQYIQARQGSVSPAAVENNPPQQSYSAPVKKTGGMFAKHCPICGLEVDKNASIYRFGKYFCSEEHAEQYAERKMANEQYRYGGGWGRGWGGHHGGWGHH